MLDRKDIAMGLVLVPLLLLASAADAAMPDPADDPNRVVLADLRPRISAAARDSGMPHGEGCHVGVEVTTPRPCRFGDRDGSMVLVVLGDSAVAQWWAAIQRASLRAGWRVVWMTKSGCPAADVTVLLTAGRPYDACDRWRRAALATIRELKRVDLVVLGGWSRYPLVSREDGSRITDRALRATEWQTGYQRTIEALAAEVQRVAILRDTPQFRKDVPRCLKAHVGRTKPCSRDRASALIVRPWRAEEAVDALYDWVQAVDLTARICKRDACWPVTSNRTLRYRDHHHITNTFARALAPAMAVRLRAVMRS